MSIKDFLWSRKEVAWLSKFLLVAAIIWAFTITALKLMDYFEVNDNFEVGEDENVPETTIEKIKVQIPENVSREAPQSTTKQTKHKKMQTQVAVNESDAHELIDLAIQGEVDAAIKFIDKFNKCKNHNESKKLAAQMSTRMEAIGQEYGVEVPDSFRKTTLENKAVDEIAECQHFLGDSSGELEHINEKIFSRLKEQAENGITTARFMYAMWGPSDNTSLLMFEDVSEYQRLANEYTTLNLQEDAALGLLALGISYTGGIYFTPLRISLGRSYLWAASLCGMNQSVTDKFLARTPKLNLYFDLGGQESKDKEVIVMEKALEIAAAMCPSFN